MNRILTSFLPLIAVACAGAQAPAPANLVTENSRIARFLTGPGDRPQGALLRNGTFVTFSPGLAQRLPASLARNASLQVVGEEFGYEGSKTIQARTMTIAGVAYNDDGPMPEDPNLIGRPGPDGRSGVVPPPPPPPSAPGVPPPPPVGRGGPPPPHAATPAPPPPPAGAPGTAAPPPPVDGATPPPPPANNAGRAAEPPAPATPPAAPGL